MEKHLFGDFFFRSSGPMVFLPETKSRKIEKVYRLCFGCAAFNPETENCMNLRVSTEDQENCARAGYCPERINLE